MAKLSLGHTQYYHIVVPLVKIKLMIRVMAGSVCKSNLRFLQQVLEVGKGGVCSRSALLFVWVLSGQPFGVK